MNRRDEGLLILGDGSVQRDLFGEVDAELAHRAENTRRRDAFAARACWMPDGSPVVWTAPYDCPAAKAGEQVPGWRCWLCGGVEVNAYVLGITHGLTPEDPHVLDRVTCARQDRAVHHAAIGGDRPASSSGARHEIEEGEGQ